MMMMNNNNKIIVGCININGLRSKVDRVKEIMEIKKISVMCILETWLENGDNAGIRPLAVDIRKARRDGMTRGNGGIVVLTKRGVKVKVIEIDSN
jgi:exonuclease III